MLCAGGQGKGGCQVTKMPIYKNVKKSPYNEIPKFKPTATVCVYSRVTRSVGLPYFKIDLKAQIMIVTFQPLSLKINSYRLINSGEVVVIFGSKFSWAISPYCKQVRVPIIVCFLFVLVGRLVHASVRQSNRPSVFPRVHLSVHPPRSARPSVRLSVRPSFIVCSFAHLLLLMSDACSCPDLSVFFSLFLLLLRLKTFFFTYFLLKFVLFTNSLDYLTSSLNVIIIFLLFREIVVDLLFVKKIMGSGYCEV